MIPRDIIFILIGIAIGFIWGYLEARRNWR